MTHAAPPPSPDFDPLFAALIPEGTPEIVSALDAAHIFRINPGTVFNAMRRGTVTTYEVADAKRGTVKGVSVRAAALLWGTKKLARAAEAAADAEAAKHPRTS